MRNGGHVTSGKEGAETAASYGRGYRLATLAEAMKRAEEAKAKAEAEGREWHGGDGIMVPAPTGALVYSHHWVVARRSSEDVAKYLQAFGLSPSSRSRVSTSDNRQGALPLEAGQDEWNAI